MHAPRLRSLAVATGKSSTLRGARHSTCPRTRAYTGR
jgi:hypothetical protein